MADRKPLVITDGQLQQLQPGDNADIPLASQVEINRIKINLISQVLIDQGFTLPDELTKDLE